jgi:anti-anti-sigma factor
MDAVRLTVPFEAIDLANVDEFTRWARDRIATDAPDDGAVVLDLGEVEFVMAAGVQALLDLDAQLADAGRTLAVVEAAPIVVRVLTICGCADRWIVA